MKHIAIILLALLMISCSKSGGDTPVVTPPTDTTGTTPPSDTTVTTPQADTTGTGNDKPDTTLGTIKAVDEFLLYTTKVHGFGEIKIAQVGTPEHLYDNIADGIIRMEFVPADPNDKGTVIKVNQTDFKVNYLHFYTGNNTTMSADTVSRYDCVYVWTSDNKKDVTKDIYFMRTHTANSPILYSIRDLQAGEASLITTDAFNNDVKYFAYKMTK